MDYIPAILITLILLIPLAIFIEWELQIRRERRFDEHMQLLNSKTNGLDFKERDVTPKHLKLIKGGK